VYEELLIMKNSDKKERRSPPRNNMKVMSAEFIKGIRGTDPIAYNGVAQVAFVGRSNVGKSSLINSLVHRKSLVKVSKKPGKTTEINFFLINKELYLVDLPGYGYASVNLKGKDKLRKLIVWYLTTSRIHPKMTVLVLDTKVGITNFDRQMIEILHEHRHPYVIAANKADKLSQSDLAKQLSLITAEAEGGEIVVCSAVTPGGSRDLSQKIF